MPCIRALVVLFSLAFPGVAAAQERPQPLPDPPAERHVQVGFGLRGGLSFQTDQALLGPHFELRGLGAPFVELDVALLAGVAVEHWIARGSTHVRAVLTIEEVRVYPLVGVGVQVHQPRGGFAEFCDKTNLECGGVNAHAELGVGFGWRWLSIDFIVGLGDLPRYNLLGAVTWVP